MILWRNLRAEAALLSLMLAANFFFAMNYALVGYLYLRGRHLPFGFQSRYQEWRRARLKKKFDVYMRRQEKKDDAGRWIN